MHKNHKKSRYYWIHGKHAVIEALKNPKRVKRNLILSEFALDQILSQKISLNSIKYSVVNVNEFRDFAKIQFGAVHQGFAMEVEPLIQINESAFIEQEDAFKKSIIVLLDKVTDPHNVGAAIRICSAFDVRGVFVTAMGSPDENATILKSASGGFENVHFIKSVNFNRTISDLKKKGYFVVGLSMNTEFDLDYVVRNFLLDIVDLNIMPKFNKKYKIAVIMGSEECGLRRLVESNCDFLAKIPISNRMESLNVSSALSIVLYSINNEFNKLEKKIEDTFEDTL